MPTSAAKSSNTEEATAEIAASPGRERDAGALDASPELLAGCWWRGEDAPRVRLRSKMLAGLFTLAMLYTLYFAKAVLIPVVLAVLLTLLLAPVVRGLRRHLHLPEGMGAALTLVLLLGTVAAAFYSLSAPASRWLAELPIALIEVEQKLQTLRQPVEDVQEAAAKVEELAEQAASPQATTSRPLPVVIEGPSLTQMFVGGAVTVIAGLVIMVALLYFLLAAGDTLLRQAVTLAPSLRDKKRVVEIAREIEDDISYYLLSISLINAGLGVTVGFAMWLLDMPNPLLWAVMAALLNYVPFLGAVTGIGVVGLVALLTFDEPAQILMPPLVYLFLTSLEAQFATPAILARRLTLNPVAVFLGLIVFTWLWGFAGALLAIPMLAAFKICCDHLEPLHPIGTMLGR